MSSKFFSFEECDVEVSVGVSDSGENGIRLSCENFEGITVSAFLSTASLTVEQATSIFNKITDAEAKSFADEYYSKTAMQVALG